MRKLIFASNSLIVLCGPAGSGKSYFAQKYFRPSQIVSSDFCREMISDDPNNQRVSPDSFDLFYTIVGYRLKYNRLTLADATHLMPSFRQPLLNLAQQYNRPIYLVLFETDLETCCKNNSSRPRQVEHEVIITQMEKFQRVKEQLAEEPYQAIYSLKPQDMDDLIIDLASFVL